MVATRKDLIRAGGAFAATAMSPARAGPSLAEPLTDVGVVLRTLATGAGTTFTDTVKWSFKPPGAGQRRRVLLALEQIGPGPEHEGLTRSERIQPDADLAAE